MKKKRVVLTLLISCLFLLTNAKASRCVDEEFAKIYDDASKVKVTYEIKSKEIDNPVEEVSDTGYRPEKITVDYFQVNIVNLTDKLYIKITNDQDGSVRTYTSNDANNGVVSYEIEDINNVAKLAYTLYTSSNTNCASEELYKNELTLPMYNVFYQVGPCIGEVDVPECQKYVTSEVDTETIRNLSYKETTEAAKDIKKEEDNKKGFIEKNKKIILIGGSIIIVMGAIATTVVIRKRRSRLI
ncbi:MAG: hypothetical protein J5634_01010 [Bacilli bacterium]|nr:hypothetical protein [Bacilli bacterium]